MKKAGDALTAEGEVDACAQSIDEKALPPPLPPECQTANDEIVHSGAPPVVAPANNSVTAEVPANRSLDELQIHTPQRRKQESAGWLSSIILHAALIAVIGLILAPADYGGANALELIITLSDQEAKELAVPPVEVAIAINESAAEDSEDQDTAPPLMEPVPVAANSGAPAGKPAENASGDALRGRASPRGTFFGIDAHGHEFVYVLDMSGSMEGRRYRRATAELERSVSELHPTQNFYVILFDDDAVQMFNGKGMRPKSVPATAENKSRLSHWLSTAFRGGGTDPRDALRIALRMNPSAIFMLSDGKFNGKKNKRSSPCPWKLRCILDR